MKIAILSDIHVESWDLEPYIEIPDADVYVFAGDIGEKFNGVNFINSRFKGKHCIYVPGNYEYRGMVIDTHRNDLLSKIFHSGGIFDNQTYVIGGKTHVRFICSTLWSDFNDYLSRNKESVDFISHELSRSFKGITVVVSHFAPHYLSIEKQYKKDSQSVNLPDSLIGMADYWIHGHTHTCFDYFIGKCRVICHPFGYKQVIRQDGCADSFKVIEI